MQSGPTIAQMLASAERPLFGFQFFPPRDEASQQQLWTAISRLEPLHPDFVSVTYGASGSTRERTVEATRTVGSRIAAEVAVTLLRRGAPELQFFTQNRSLATREIYAMLLEHRWWTARPLSAAAARPPGPRARPA